MATAVLLALVVNFSSELLVAAPAHPADGTGPVAAPTIPVQRYGSATDLPPRTTAEATGAGAGGPGTGHGAPSVEPPASGAPAPVARVSNRPQFAAGAETVPPAAPPRTASPVEIAAPTSGAGRSGHERDDDASVELVAERTENTRTFQNSDGTRSRLVFQEPVNRRTADGSWEAVNTSLAREGARWTMRGSAFGLSLADRGTGAELETLTLDGGLGVGYTLTGAASVAPVVTGATAVYPSILPDTDLSVTALTEGVKEELVLAGPRAGNTWSFPVRTAGLTPALTGDGEVVLRDAAGAERMRVPRGLMHDSAPGAPNTSTAVRYGLREEGGRYTLTVTADRAWLDDPARVYPVVVDPTTVTAPNPASASTYVDDFSGANYAGNALLLVGGDGTGHRFESYLSFAGLRGTLANDYVVSAALHLFQTYASAAGAVSVTPITAPWSPTGVNRVGGVTTGAEIGSATFGAGQGWGWIGIGSAGVAMLDDCTHGLSPSDCGLALRGPAGALRSFASAASANKPYLQINYSAEAAYYATVDGAPVSPPVTNSQPGEIAVTVTNHGEQTWQPGSGYRLSYRLYDPATLAEMPVTSRVYTSMPVDVPPNTQITLNGAIGALPPRSYVVCWDMVSRSGGWFSDLSGIPPGGCFTLEVTNLDPVVDAQAPPDGFSPATLTPVLTVTGRDVDSWPSALTYTLHLAHNGNVVTYPAQAGGTFQVRPGDLVWNQTYAWWVDLNDGREMVSSPVARLTPRVPQPGVAAHLGSATDPVVPGVDPLTGDYTTSATDATVPTAGPPLDVTRVYNSLDTRASGLFGTGWSSPYDTRLTFDGHGDALITLPDGQRVRFAYNADGSYTPPAGRFATLVAVGTTGLDLTDKTGTVLHFDAAARLASTTDANGLAVRYTYTVDGLLTGATSDASGRTLRFTWGRPTGSTAQHVTRVTTDPVTTGVPSSALTWTYDYLGDLLVKVCAPDAGTNCTKYDYTGISHYSSLVTDAVPTTYLRLADPVTAGSTGATARDEVVHCAACSGPYYTAPRPGGPGALYGSPDGAAVFDGNATAVYDFRAATGANNQGSVELWFKAAAGSGGILYSYQSRRLDGGVTTPPSSPDVPALYVGTDGRLYGGFQDITHQPLAGGRVVSDGAWHHAVITASGNGQALYLDGQWAAGRGAAVVPLPASDIGIIGGGNTVAGYPGLDPERRTSYFGGSIDEFASYSYALTPEQVGDHYRARQVGSALSSITLPSGRNYATIGYDLRRDRVADLTDSNGGHWKPSVPEPFHPAGVSHTEAVLAARPSAYYTMGETSGTVAHSAVHGIDGDRNGTFTNVTLGLPQPGMSGNAPGRPTVADFGATSLLSLPEQTVPTTGDFTVEIQFSGNRPGVLLGTADRLLGAYQAAGPGEAQPLLYVGTDGRLHGGLGSTPGDILTSDRISGMQDWHTAAYSWDSAAGRGRLYLDGRQQDTGAPPAPNRATQKVALAGAGYLPASWPGAGTEVRSHFQGGLGHLAVFPRALSADELRRTYDAQGIVMGEYQGVQLRTTVTDPAGRTLGFGFDPAAGGRRTSSTDALGGVTSFHYDERGYPDRTTDPAGHSVTLVNDSRGNVLSRTTCRTPTSCQTSYTDYWTDPRNPTDPRNDRPISLREARSSGPADTTYQTTYQYDAAGNLLHTLTPPTPGFPGGRDTAQQYSTGPVTAYGGGTVPAGRLTSVTAPGGGVTSYRYYRNTDLAQVTEPGGTTTTYAYDNLGRRTGSTVTWPGGPPAGLTTTTAYDSRNRVVRTDSPPLSYALNGLVHYPVRQIGYDADGNVLSTVESDNLGGETSDPSRTRSTTYDSAGRVATTTDPDGRQTVVNGYDPFGRPTSVTDTAGRTWETARSENGQPVSLTLKGYTGSDPDHPETPRDLRINSYSYDPAGRLAATADAMGRTQQYRYYDDGLLARATAVGFHNPDGSTRDIDLQRIDYDAAGHPVTVTTGGGAGTTTLGYDADARVVSTTVRGTTDQVTATEYDADGNRTRTVRKDRAGTVLTAVDSRYDTAGRLVASTAHTGTEDLTTTWTRDGRGLITASTDPRGNAPGADPAAYTTDYAYDAAGRPVLTTAPPVAVENGGAPATTRPTTAAAYNTYGDRMLGRDELGTLTAYDYDSNGRPNSRTVSGYRPPGSSTPLTNSTAVSYTASGQVASVVEAGRTTTYSYDQLDNLLTRTDPKADAASPAGVWKSTYDPLGELLSTTDPTGAVATATYDDLGRQVTTTAVLRKPRAAYTSTTGWDDAGNPVTVTDPLGNTTTTGYDAAGLPVAVTDPLGRRTTTAYDAAGRAVRVTAPDGSGGTVRYDGAGRQTGTADLDPAGTILRTTAAEYDRAGNPTATTDPLGVRTTRTYDAASRLTGLTEPVTAGTSITSGYGYDAAGNRTRFTDGRGNAFLTTYNAWGLPESMVEPATAAYPNAADRTRTISYDAALQPFRLAEPGGVVRTRAYDGLGRLVTETGSGAEAATTSHTYGYDLAGRMLRVAGVGGDNTFGYDDRGLLTTTTGPSGDATFGYDAAGQLTARTDPAGSTAFTYDRANRPASITDAITGVRATYGYNSLDQVTSVGYGTGGAVRSFGYDALHRVASDTLTAPGGATEASVEYRYDLADHLVGKTTTGTAAAATNTYGYDLAGRLTSWNNGSTRTDYGYDASGNRVRAGPATAVYDARNRLVSDGTTEYRYSARGTRTAAVTAAGTTNSAYDAFDRLISDAASGYSYDGLDRLAASGTRTFRYSGAGNVLAGDGSALYNHDATGGLFSWEQGGSTALALVDRHTDVVGGFTATGTALTGSVGYDPFGAVLGTAGTRPARGYQSAWTDPATGRANMAARWYDPATGAFTSRDTIDQNQAPSVLGNHYAYAAQDPLDQTDPSGHCAILCSAIVGAIAGAVIGVGSYAYDYATTDGAKWNWGDAGWSAAKGAVSGAIYGATGGGGLLLAGAGGAAAGLSEYAMDCLYGTGACDAEGAVGAAAGGALTGAVGWGFAKVGGKIVKTVAGKIRGSAARGVEEAGGRAVAKGAGAGGRAAAESAEESFAALAGAIKAARVAAAEAKELAAKKAAADAAAAEAKRAAEEAAYQRWLATPPGRAVQAARNEGVDVAVARTAQAADRAVPTSALPAQATPSLSENIVRAAGVIGDNAAASTAARAPAGRAGTILADATAAGSGRSSGGLGSGAAPASRRWWNAEVRTSRFGGDYLVPTTPGLKQRINPSCGTENCGPVAVAADQLLAGRLPAAVDGAAQRIFEPELERLAGSTREFVQKGGFSGVVNDVRSWGNGARGIVLGRPTQARLTAGEGGHYFNVINDNGLVVFLDAQSGKAAPEGWRYYYLLRTD
ncbi:LamG-like jellyroll fold domain-containing protein [Kitasatospora sp. NPDC094019]|uniref:LamG-like jellyroll fold domain-containing protein n=1 Tax=Kitasatospora sp. NPDC094019 TaxID=3364091 RepID=UPI003823900C